MDQEKIFAMIFEVLYKLFKALFEKYQDTVIVE